MEKVVTNFQRRLGDGLIGKAKNPDYSDQKVIDFLMRDDYDILIAFEPKGCDRNRAFELLGPALYSRVKDKFVDFQRQFFKPISTTESTIANKLYTVGGAQWQIEPYLFLNAPELEVEFSPQMLPAAGFGKCGDDVRKLYNLVKLWELCLFNI